MAFHFTHLLAFYSQMFESLFFRQRFMSKMRNDGKSSRTIQFQHKFCVVISTSVADEIGLPPRKCARACVSVYGHRKYACIHKSWSKFRASISYAMCLSSKRAFSSEQLKSRVCACVSVCLHTITLIILHSKKILIDDTSCQNVCTIHFIWIQFAANAIQSLCEMRDRECLSEAITRNCTIFPFGPIHTHTRIAFIWLVNISFIFSAFLNKWEKRIRGKNPVLFRRFILNTHNKRINLSLKILAEVWGEWWHSSGSNSYTYAHNTCLCRTFPFGYRSVFGWFRSVKIKIQYAHPINRNEMIINMHLIVLIK